MSHHAHDIEDDAPRAHAHPAPTLPEVTDEAGNTANWVPALGLGLLALVGIMLAVHLAMHDATGATGATGATAAAQPATNHPVAVAPIAAAAAEPAAPAPTQAGQGEANP